MAAITANNIVISVEISDFPQDGNPTYAMTSIGNMNCLVRSYSRQSKLSSLDLSSIADINDRLYFTRASGTVELEIYVDPTSVLDWQSDALVFHSKLGFYCKVQAEIPYIIAGPTVWVDEGVISDVSLSMDLDGILIEKVTITLGTYGAS
jgi:hypothetical protein